MKKLLWSVGKSYLSFCSSLNALASFSILLVMVFVCCDVIGRVVFNNPIVGTAEIVKIGVVCLVFMQVPWAFWEERHVRSDIVTGRLGPKRQQLAKLFRSLVALLAAVAISISNWDPMIKAWQTLEYEGEGALRVPVYPLFTIIQLSGLLIVLIMLYRIVITVYELIADH